MPFQSAVQALLARLAPPVWARWVLSFAVGAIALVLLVIVVAHSNPNGLAPQNPAAVVRANREAETLVEQDQAPRVTTAAARTSARSAIERAVRADMGARVSLGQITGPLQRVTCARAARRSAYSCTATAADVNYDYLGVVDARAHRVTYCRRDPPPVPSENIPVSARCTG